MKFDASQTSAIDRATTTRLTVITGGAGTGKTTIIRTITERLEMTGESVLLCAFAGKAAARLREACEHPASTIHRMLGYNGKAFTLPDLANKSVIVDESSMVDAQLMAEIMMREPSRLVLVGDPAQLPPVGRGQPFHDIISLRSDLVCHLERCYRATEAVYQAANAIRHGGRPPMHAQSKNEKWTISNTGKHEATQAKIMQWIEAGALDFEKDVILVARNGDSDEDHCTVRGLNAAIVNAISPRSADSKHKFHVGDRVINTTNMPDLDVWNGTTGTVHAVDQDGGVWVRTDVPVLDMASGTADKPAYTSHVRFAREAVKALQFAYAMTVHKAQGSQYRNVLLACFHRDTWGLMDRALLYTGVTRTQSACAVVGEVGSVWSAIDKVNEKRTVLQELAEQEDTPITYPTQPEKVYT
jgi:exodeoxyribonuclease V alpha subunit